MAKPMPVQVDYFADEILRRVSKSFAKAEISRAEFDEIVDHLDSVRKIVNRSEENVQEAKGDPES